MPAAQLERLKQDIEDLATYAKVLEKRGLVDRVHKILEKKTFLEERLEAYN